MKDIDVMEVASIMGEKKDRKSKNNIKLINYSYIIWLHFSKVDLAPPFYYEVKGSGFNLTSLPVRHLNIRSI